jgi:hypothetical protein
MSKQNNNMLKVVYFDEESAIDYVDIFNGGLKNTVSSEETADGTNSSGSIGAGIKTGILFKALEPLINLNLKGKLETGFSSMGESAFKTTISNTVLSDFIKLADNDDNIEKTINYKVSAYHNSITFMKMYSPYFNMVNLRKNENELQDASINFQKVDKTLEKGKGYYELVGENDSDNKVVLRFNFKAFRNNYNLVDLTRMNLMFYSVKVGNMDIDNLDASKEFDFTKKDKIITSSEIMEGIQEDNHKQKYVSVYDVILAGIKIS